MSRHLPIIALMLLLGLTAVTKGEELSSDPQVLERIASIGHEGVSFDTSRRAFQKMKPGARLMADEDGVLGVSRYIYSDSAGKIDFASAIFLDDDLSELWLTYDNKRIMSYGGESALLDRAIQRFGQPSKIVGANALWNFPTIDRQVKVVRTDEMWGLIISRPSIEEKLSARKMQTSAGFY